MLIELIFIYYLVFLFNLLTIIFQIRINLIMIHLVQYALLILFINYSLIRKIKIYLIKKKYDIKIFDRINIYFINLKD